MADHNDAELCTLGSASLDEDLVAPVSSTHPHPVAPAPGAQTRDDAALLRLCRVMSVATLRSGNAHTPPMATAAVRVLTMLAASDAPLTLTEIADCLGARDAEASQICARLVREGYLLRLPAHDAEIRLSLTPAGIAALTAVNTDRLARIRTLFDRLDPDGRQTVLTAAGLIAAATADDGGHW